MVLNKFKLLYMYHLSTFKLIIDHKWQNILTIYHIIAMLSPLLLCQMVNLEALKTSGRANRTEGQQCVLIYIKASMLISWLVMWGWAARGSAGIWTALLCCPVLGRDGQVRHVANTRLSAKLDWNCTASVLALSTSFKHHNNLWILLSKKTKQTPYTAKCQKQQIQAIP